MRILISDVADFSGQGGGQAEQELTVFAATFGDQPFEYRKGNTSCLGNSPGQNDSRIL